MTRSDPAGAGADVSKETRNPPTTPVRPPLPRGPHSRHDVPAALGVFVVVLLSLQVFLLTVGIDALLADEDAVAWVAAACSVVLAAGSAAFYRFLR